MFAKSDFRKKGDGRQSFGGADFYRSKKDEKTSLKTS